MAYTPTEWVCGDTVTADKLNNLEDGIQEALECCGGGGTLVLNVDHEDDNYVYYNHTWQEVYDALINGDYVTIPKDEYGSAIQDHIRYALVQEGYFSIREAMDGSDKLSASSATESLKRSKGIG